MKSEQDSQRSSASLAYSNYKKRRQEQRVAILENRFGNIPWLQKLAWLYDSAYIFSFVIQAISVFAAFFGAFWLIDHMMPHPIISILLAVIVFYFVESWKRKSSDSFWDIFWRDGKFSRGWFGFSLILFLISVGSSGVGTWKAVYAIDEGPEIITNDSTLLALKAKDAELSSNIAASKKTTWKGKITTRSQDAIKNFSSIQADLYQDIQKRKSEIEGENSKLTNEHETNLWQIALFSLLLYLFLELIFEACMGFCSYYDYELYLALKEQKEAKKTSSSPTNNSGNYNYQSNLPTPDLQNIGTMNEARRPMGFQMPKQPVPKQQKQSKQLFQKQSKREARVFDLSPNRKSKQLVPQASQPVTMKTETPVTKQLKQETETVRIVSAPPQDVSKWRRYANTYFKRSQKQTSEAATREKNYSTYLEYKDLLETTGKFKCVEKEGENGILEMEIVEI